MRPDIRSFPDALTSATTQKSAGANHSAPIMAQRISKSMVMRHGPASCAGSGGSKVLEIVRLEDGTRNRKRFGLERTSRQSRRSSQLLTPSFHTKRDLIAIRP